MSKNLIVLKDGNDFSVANEESLLVEFSKRYQEIGKNMVNEDTGKKMTN